MAKAVPEELSEGALRAKLGRRHRATHPTLPPQHHSPLPHSPLPHPPPHTRLVDSNRPKDAAASMDLLRAGWRVGGGVRWRPPVSRARARALSHTQTQTHLPLARASLPPAPFLFDTAACFDRALALGRALSARAALRRRPHTRARSHSYPSLPSPSFCRRTCASLMFQV